MGKRITVLLNDVTPPIPDPSVAIQQSNSTRRIAYRAINPHLIRAKLYDDPLCPEYARIAATRMRLGSHRLRLEMSRWSRQSRENCLCPCPLALVQDEHHVLIECPLTKTLRDNSDDLRDITSVYKLFNETDPKVAAVYCYNVLSLLC